MHGASKAADTGILVPIFTEGADPLMATDGEIVLIRDMLARLDAALRDHIREVQESRQRTAAELNKLSDTLNDLKLWKAKVVGIAGFLAFAASFLADWLKSFIHTGR